MLRALIEKLVLLHARAPYYPGKWRNVEALLALGGLPGEPARTMDVLRHGLRWQLSTDCTMQRRLLYHGAFDIHDVRALLAPLGPGSVFFDLGSYFGYYSLLATQRGATAYAFEALGENFALLDKHRTLNHATNLHAYHNALSDTEGEAQFARPDQDNRGRGHLATEGDHGAVERVPMIPLDTFVAREGIQRLDALKLDVEGAEIRVFRGARETLRRFHPLMLVELNPPCLARFGATEADLLAEIRTHGYSIFRIERGGLRPYTGLAPGESYVNILCRV
jgi:FkbM family methyltransferase